MNIPLDAATSLPADGFAGTLVGRAWVPGDPPGPAVVVLREAGVFDITRTFPTVAELAAVPDPVTLVRNTEGKRLGSFEEILANSSADARTLDRPYFLAPVDL